MAEPILHGLHRKLVRIQLTARSRPLRMAVVLGVLSGVLFGVIVALLMADLLAEEMGPRDTVVAIPAWLPWLFGAGGGVFFGVVMGLFAWVFASRVNPAPLAPDTDPDALIAARRRVREGRRSEDPEVDRLVVSLVAQTQAAGRLSDPRWLAWFSGATLTVGLGANIVAIQAAPEGLTWLYGVGIILFAGVLCALPWTVRSARRARSLAESIEASRRGEEGGDA